jgi:hypothetical protein
MVGVQLTLLNEGLHWFVVAIIFSCRLFALHLMIFHKLVNPFQITESCLSIQKSIKKTKQILHRAGVGWGGEK